MSDEISCAKLRGMEISSVRCRMKRNEEIAFWGSVIEATARCGCPCDKKGEDMKAEKAGKKVSYKSIGICPMCERPDKRLYAYHGQVICGNCKGKKNKESKGDIYPSKKLDMTRAEAKKEYEDRIAVIAAEMNNLSAGIIGVLKALGKVIEQL